MRRAPQGLCLKSRRYWRNAAPKARDIAPKVRNVAPKALDMKARGKRAARRPWFMQSALSGLKGRNRCSITPFQGWMSLIRVPGATRCALAPGFHIPRLRRWIYLYARLLKQRAPQSVIVLLMVVLRRRYWRNAAPKARDMKA